MSDNESKTPVDQLLDLFVFAPVGLAVSARDELPRLVERGRSQVEGQVLLARMVGRFAVTQGRREAEKLAERWLRPDPAPAPAPRPSSTRSAAPAPERTASPASAPASGNGAAPPVESLAIPGYDALAASQVVQRLAGLSPEELDAVRAYEEATRHRKTILNQVARLQAGVTP